MNRSIFTKFLNKNNNSNCKKYYKTCDSLFYNNKTNYKLNNGKIVNVSELESKIKKNYNGDFIIFGREDYNVLVTDKYVNIFLINDGIENFLKIKQIIIVNNVQQFKLS